MSDLAREFKLVEVDVRRVSEGVGVEYRSDDRDHVEVDEGGGALQAGVVVAGAQVDERRKQRVGDVGVLDATLPQGVGERVKGAELCRLGHLGSIGH